MLGLAALLAAPGLPAVDLRTVYEMALQSDPVYRAAGAANRAAQEIRPQARSLLLPTLSGFGATTGVEVDTRRSANPQTPTGSQRFNETEFGLSLSQPIFRRDRWIALEQADYRIRQADAELAFAEQELMVRVSGAYFDVLLAEDELGFTEAEREAFGQQLRQSQQRFEVGLIAITDVEEAQAGFDLATAQVIAAENQLDNAREQLREITGEYLLALAPLGEDVPLTLPDPPDIDAWTRTALEQNLRLLAARLAAETAREEIRRVEAGHLPTLDLVGRHARNSSGRGFGQGGGGSSSRSHTSSIGIQLNVPLYEGGRVMSQTRESRHLYQQRNEELERSRREAQREARNAFLGVESGISRVRALDQAVRSTISARDAVEAGFQVGTRTSVEVLNAQRDVFRAQRDRTAARYQYILDILRLKLAAGTLAEQDIEAVSALLQ